ncbi:hypothetical protein J7L48_11610, partial [bacterium]|nr:hypothetical protein [bacterium]
HNSREEMRNSYKLFHFDDVKTFFNINLNNIFGLYTDSEFITYPEPLIVLTDNKGNTLIKGKIKLSEVDKIIQ